MKALIIGGAGFIGCHLAKHLLKQNFSVDIMDIHTIDSRDKDLKSILSNTDCARYLCRNIDDSKSLTDTDKDYTHIIHLAALLGVENVIKNSYEVLDKNVSMTINAIKIAEKQKDLKRFLYASTSEVYAGTLNHGLLNIPTPETSILVLPELSLPRTSYMLSKVYGEALCHNSGLPYTIIRPHNIYGPRMGVRHVIPQLLQRAHYCDTRTLDVYSPKHTRTFCFIDDATSMISEILQKTSAIGETVNIGTQQPEITMYQLAKMIIKITGKTLKIKEMPDTEGSPFRRAPNMSKLRSFIRLKAPTKLIDGISTTYDWYKPQFDKSKKNV